MNSGKRILTAFLLNLLFSCIELIGGVITGSVAIISDSVHDLGDALSIGLTFVLEKVSQKSPDNAHTYGYLRYSVLGGLITSLILTIGSVIIIHNSILRLFNPTEINPDGMIILAIFGTIINFAAEYFTHGGNSINQRAVSLHLLEDLLGWIIVLIGAILIKFTNINYIDAAMSIGLGIFIFINALKTLKEILDIFLEKTPKNINIDHIIESISEIEGILKVHRIGIRSLDGIHHIASVSIEAESSIDTLKNLIKEKLYEHGIFYATVEVNGNFENYEEKLVSAIKENSHHNHTHTHDHN